VLGKNEDFKFHRGSGSHPPASPEGEADGGQVKKILKHLGLWDIKARPPPKATATPPDFQIDYSARDSFTCRRLRPFTIPNLAFCVYNSGDRSGPGILRSRPVRIIFTRLNFPKGTLFNWVYSDPEYPIEAYGS